MRLLSFVLSFVLSINLFAQSIVINNLISIETISKNSKKIIFSKKTTDFKSYYVLEAKNKTTKDYSKCIWKSNLSNDELKFFVKQISKIQSGTDFKSSVFALKYRKSKLRVYFNKTICAGEHKTHYFQKSCSRVLSFVLYPNEIELIIRELSKSLNEI